MRFIYSLDYDFSELNLKDHYIFRNHVLPRHIDYLHKSSNIERWLGCGEYYLNDDCYKWTIYQSLAGKLLGIDFEYLLDFECVLNKNEYLNVMT